jgi:hypothetical protein
VTEHFLLSAAGISLKLTATGGIIDGLAIERDGQRIAPLHRAPWVDRPDEVPAGEAPHLALLAGDFFCAPFGGSPAGSGVPAHGWTANGAWSESARNEQDGRLEVVFELAERVHGAAVEKRIILRDDHPVVYQVHTLKGGSGHIPIAHHAMIHVPGGASLSFSQKDFGRTPAKDLGSPGDGTQAVLVYPQHFDSLAAVRLRSGETVDASRYPFTTGHEDFLSLFDPPSASIGWSAAVAAHDGFVFFALKDAAVLPQTSLWMSNGGRPFAPWNSRHTNVLGIEESCTHFGDGLAAAAGESDLSRAGYRTSVDLSGGVTVRYALGAVPLPAGFTRVADIARVAGGIELVDVSGARHPVPFDTAFFGHW